MYWGGLGRKFFARDDVSRCFTGSEASLAHVIRKPILTDTHKISVFREGYQPPFMLYKYVALSVTALLFWCSPPAVARLIALGSVFSIKRRARGSGPHVSKESGKVGNPLRTHTNSTTAVTRVRGVVRMNAPRLGASPRNVLSGGFTAFRSPSAVPMSYGMTPRGFFSIAPTTCGTATPDAAQADIFFNSAITAKDPASLPGFRRGFTYRNPATVTLSSNAQWRIHASLRIIMCKHPVEYT